MSSRGVGGQAVTVKLNDLVTLDYKPSKDFWQEVMLSPELKASLQSAADTEKSRLQGQLGVSKTPHKFRNADFYSDTALRNGSNSPYYIGLVKAGNPRSIYKMRNKDIQ